MRKIKLSNWTNYPVAEVSYDEPSFVEDFGKRVLAEGSFIARGNGRCYGDASLGENVLSTLALNNILSFDFENGVIDVQSGVLLSDLLDFIVPKGWFLPVTPGTKFITIGGAIASNVHGKNHHVVGAFSQHVLSMKLLGADNQVSSIAENSHKELFDLTCGGMGLTGIVLSASIQLKKIETSYIRTKNIKARNLREIFDLFDKHKDYTYSVAWIDCYQKGPSLGRSILMVGEHASEAEISHKMLETKLVSSPQPKFSLPFNFPSWALNKLSIKAFNFLFYHKQLRKESVGYSHYEPFFYPLDAILEWNKMYGVAGFVQYQFVLPLENSLVGMEAILKEISERGFGSFLAVLKLLGQSDNDISFPISGYTLALDFPIKKGLFQFLDRLDELVVEYGGRIYLSKDARMTSKTLDAGYSDMERIKSEIKKYNPQSKFSSFLSKRLKING
jgi:decaprenylphospho-beta-D-ribofuranose 2-oxidase